MTPKEANMSDPDYVILVTVRKALEDLPGDVRANTERVRLVLNGSALTLIEAAHKQLITELFTISSHQLASSPELKVAKWATFNRKIDRILQAVSEPLQKRAPTAGPPRR